MNSSDDLIMPLSRTARNGCAFSLSSDKDRLKDMKTRVFVVLSAAAMPVLMPFISLKIIHILWKEFNLPVDRHTCTCSCWDTVFKGQYESGVAAYKHIYFNVTSNTFKIWTVTVMYLLGLYECTKRTVTLIFLGHLRPCMLLLLLVVIYPHYYAWWSYFNYWNDDYYNQWYHQLYFSITEMISTLVVVRLLDSRNKPKPNELLIIITIAFCHISANLYDQFITNVVKGEGKLHQVLRDLGLMTPDIVHLAVPLYEIRKLSLPIRKLFTLQELAPAGCFVLISWIIILVI